MDKKDKLSILIVSDTHENIDNLNLFEESSDIRDIKNYTSMANSRNIIGEKKMKIEKRKNK